MNKQDAAVVKALQELLHLKEWKEKYGKDLTYQRDQPIAWEKAAAALKQSLAQPQGSGKPTDISKRLREYSSNPGYSHNDYADTMLAAAEEIERYYGGMLAWKSSAEEKDAAAPQQQAPVVPEGWKLVPIEADHKMRDAGFAAFRDKGLFDDIFRAMALAAPALSEPLQRDERALFERDSKFESDFLEFRNGEYVNPFVQSAWEGWQACAASKGKSPITEEGI